MRSSRYAWLVGDWRRLLGILAAIDWIDPCADLSYNGAD